MITPWAVMYQFWSWVPDDALAAGEGVYCTMPMFHNSGRSAFNYSLVSGARFVTRDRFSAAAFWDDVRTTDCRTAALIGPMTALLYSAPPSPADGDNPLRDVILGPMIPEIDDFERRFGVRTATCYGQTEVGIPIATGWDHGPWANCGRRRMDYPWPDAVVANEHDEPVAPGEVGELLVRSAEPWALNVGYYKMPEQTVEAWRNGWFHTGDAFRVDDDGWYYFVDRLHDAIRRRGENISSFEVETFVTEHDDVRGVRRDRGSRDPRRRRRAGRGDRARPCDLRSGCAPRVPRAAHAAVHAPALRGSGRRPAAHRGVDARAKARAPCPRRDRRHLRPREATHAAPT